MGLTFEWDRRKTIANRLKHGVSFEEAATAFGDPFSLTFSNGVRGKDAQRFTAGSNVVVLDPDVAKQFPDSHAVNEALRLFLPRGRARALLSTLARRRAKRSKN